MKKSFALICLILAFGLANFSMEKFNVFAIETGEEESNSNSSQNSCDTSATQTFERFHIYFNTGKLSSDTGATLDKGNALGFWKYIFYEALNELYYVHGISVQKRTLNVTPLVQYYSVHKQPEGVAKWEFAANEDLLPGKNGKITAQEVFELICGSDKFKNLENKKGYESILKNTSHIQMMCLIANEAIYAEVMAFEKSPENRWLNVNGKNYTDFEHKENIVFKSETWRNMEYIDGKPNHQSCINNPKAKKLYFDKIKNAKKGIIAGKSYENKVAHRLNYDFARNLVYELYLISHDDIYVPIQAGKDNYSKTQARAVLKAMNAQGTYRFNFDSSTANETQGENSSRSEAGVVQQDLAFGDANLSASAVARSQSSFDVGRYLSIGSEEDRFLREYFACGEGESTKYFRFRYRGDSGEEKDTKVTTGDISQLQQGLGVPAGEDEKTLEAAREDCELIRVEIEHNQVDWTIYTFFQQIVRILVMVIGTLAVLVLVFGAVRLITANGDDGQITEAKDIIFYAVIGVVIAYLANLLVGLLFSL